jgi:hypothetical protein
VYLRVPQDPHDRDVASRYLVEGVSNETTAEDLRDYFAKFGELEEADVKPHPDSPNRTQGYLKYAKPTFEMKRQLVEDVHEILGNRVSVAPQHKKKKHIHSRANHGSTRDGSRSQHPGPGAFGLPPSTGFPAPGFPAGGFPPPPGYGMPMHPDAAYAYAASGKGKGDFGMGMGMGMGMPPQGFGMGLGMGGPVPPPPYGRPGGPGPMPGAGSSYDRRSPPNHDRNNPDRIFDRSDRSYDRSSGPYGPPPGGRDYDRGYGRRSPMRSPDRGYGGFRGGGGGDFRRRSRSGYRGGDRDRGDRGRDFRRYGDRDRGR